MPDIFDMVGDATTTDKGTIYDYNASAGEAFGAGLERSIDTNPFALGVRAARTFSEDMGSLAGAVDRIDQKTAEEEVRSRGLDLKIPVGGITRYELDTLQYLKQREIRQNTVSARTHGVVGTAAGFAGGLAGSLTDPINVASNFIPFVSEARYARWLAQAGESTLARAAVRVGAGAIEGAAGAAVVEPLVYAGATSEQLDYTSSDSFLNVAFGGVMGGGLHAIGGAVYDARVSRALKSLDVGLQGNDVLRQIAHRAPEYVRQDALGVAVRSLEDDAPVRSDQVFAEHYGLTDRDIANKSYDFSREQLNAARAAVVIGRVGDEGAAQTSLLQTIRAMGGVKVRGADGQITREGAEILASLGDTRMPGLVNNKRGVTADYLREALTEDGWFKSKDTTATDLQELYDILDAAARGEQPTRYGETRGASVRKVALRELSDAGVKDTDSVRAATMKVAEHRAIGERERIAEDPDFEPMEVLHRAEAGDEDELSGPVTDEILGRYEPSPLGRMIETARQERKKSTFDRQFVDEDPTPDPIPASKGDDDLAKLAAETEFLDSQINGMKARELWTAEDDAALEAGEEAAKSYERAAEVYKAAATCMTE